MATHSRLIFCWWLMESLASLAPGHSLWGTEALLTLVLPWKGVQDSLPAKDPWLASPQLISA